MSKRSALDSQTLVLYPGLKQEPALELMCLHFALCPGDFAAVKRQINLLAAALSADEFLTQLQAEHRLKSGVRQLRSMGFVP